jgi:acetylornithine deacetylase/succinyl-diaminopimelate desuccinylase-like protein
MEIAAANRIREVDPELDAQLRTTISPTMLSAGIKVNVIPNVAEAQLDIRRLPNETRAEVMTRLRAIIRDSAIEIVAAPGQEMPPTEASPVDTPLYRAMEKIFHATGAESVVVPYMQRGATDGAFLRQKGMPVYGVPLFLRDEKGSRSHGNDERIAIQDLERGADLLLKIVLAVSR